jgi:hypothetical protein
MAFSWAGDLSGAKPVLKRFQIAGSCYAGQLLKWDANAGGAVEAVVAATAKPEATQLIAGICTAVVTSPTWTPALYFGDMATYDTTQADLVANDPVGAAMVDVVLITPTTLIKAPIYHTANQTALTCNTETAGSADGLTVTAAFDHTSVADNSTLYCRAGANAGQYRKVNNASATAPTCLVAFTYDIAIGDKFVLANIKEGFSAVEFTTYINGIDGVEGLTHAWYVYVHELNLAEAGREYAVFTISTRHLL